MKKEYLKPVAIINLAVFDIITQSGNLPYEDNELPIKGA